MVRRRLLIGTQTFREVREDDCFYVDNATYIVRLLARGKHFFLARPRWRGSNSAALTKAASQLCCHDQRRILIQWCFHVLSV